MPRVGLKVVGTDRLFKALANDAVNIEQRHRALRRHYSYVLREAVRRRAPRGSGAPGPLGRYVRSIRTDGRGHVYSTDPRARRFEYGYHGPDRKGRRYNQPPRAHFGPGVDDVRPAYYRAHEVLVRQLWRQL